jgi:hypothetical protein
MFFVFGVSETLVKRAAEKNAANLLVPTQISVS